MAAFDDDAFWNDINWDDPSLTKHFGSSDTKVKTADSKDSNINCNDDHDQIPQINVKKSNDQTTKTKSANSKTKLNATYTGEKRSFDLVDDRSTLTSTSTSKQRDEFEPRRKRLRTSKTKSKNAAKSSDSSNTTAKASTNSNKKNKNKVKTSKENISHSNFGDKNKDNNAPLCKGHGLPCTRYQSKKQNENYGKYFWKCSKPFDQRCKMFIWDHRWKADLQFDRLWQDMELERINKRNKNLRKQESLMFAKHLTPYGFSVQLGKRKTNEATAFAGLTRRELDDHIYKFIEQRKNKIVDCFECEGKGYFDDITCFGTSNGEIPCVKCEETGKVRMDQLEVHGLYPRSFDY